MVKTQKITTLYVVTENETKYHKIGNIQGGVFDEEWLKKHIKQHGANGLYEKMASMTKQISSMELLLINEN